MLRTGERAMMFKMYSGLIMSFSVALTLVSNPLVSNQAFGGSGAAHGGAFASTHPTFRPSAARLRNHHHHRRNFFPAVDGVFWGPWDGQPNVELGQPPSGPTSGDINYTYKLDIPWDWAHRFPPGFFGSSAQSSSPPVAYVPGCSTQTVTVPGADGKDQTVNMVRC